MSMVPVSHRDGVQKDRSWLAALAAAPADDTSELGVPAATLLAVNAPGELPSGVRFDEGAVYRRTPGRALRADVHAAPGGRRPAVVLVHGGGWAGGDRSMVAGAARRLAAAGLVTVAVDYRLGPAGRWPAARDDVIAALLWVRAVAPEIGADAGRVAVCGWSAGGTVALQAAFGLGPQVVRAAACVYPTTDLRAPGARPESAALAAAHLGPATPARLAAASPVELVASGCPPVLTVTGDEDASVPVAMLRAFHDRLDAAGVGNRLVVLPGRAHGFDLVDAQDRDVCLGEIAGFLHAHTSEGEGATS